MGIDSTALARLEVVLAKKLRQEMMTLGYPNGKKLRSLKVGIVESVAPVVENPPQSGKAA
jgi:hypothetical protein